MPRGRRSKSPSGGSSRHSTNKPSELKPRDVEREYHNRLDFSERAQASDFLNSMHQQLDSELDAAAKRSLMRVQGDSMTPTDDTLTSKVVLSARDNTVNPTAPSAHHTTGGGDPNRLHKLIGALRSRAQSLADGGTRFHEVFDSLDAHDTGEISGSKSVLGGLHALGIRSATLEDADALLEAFEGSEPGHLSYKKFLKAVMLGNTSKERVATIIEDLRWQFASVEMGDEVDSPIEVLTFLLGEGDEDGSGTIERPHFRECFQVACDKMGVKGLEEGDLRRLMDRFQTPDERVSYLDFVKVLRSDVGSPKKFSSSAQESHGYAPLASRVRDAMGSRNMDSAMLREHFLPGDIMGPHETVIPFSELETVFAVDLGIILDPSDEKDIMGNFGVGADSVDVKAMMMSWGLWEETLATTSMGDTATHLQEWSTTMPKSKHDIPTLPINPTSKAASSSKPFTRPHYTQYDANPTKSYEPAPAARAPGLARAPVAAHDRAPAQPPSRYHRPHQPSHSSNAPYSPPPPQHSNVEPSPSADNEYVRKLQMENEKLKADLSSFDLNFFEEIEDLKHNYERLKMVALSQATGNDPGSPIPPPIQAPGNTSDQALYDMDPFDSAPKKQMMDMLDRADRLSGGMGVALSPRQESMYRPKKKKKKKALYGTDYDHWNARGGVVGAHERKLAWQISGGGYEALEEAEKWIRRMDRNGDSYLSGKQIAAALREAGYDLTDSDVQIVLNGFGSDQYGRVDVSEFTQALHDIASGNDWYQQDYRIPVAGTGISGGGASDLPASQALNRSGEFMYGTAFNGVQSSYEGKWDGFDASRESNLVEAALKEIVEQISLIDISKLPGYGSGNRAAAILRPFKVCDKARKGIISITEFSACIEALGLVLTAGEVRALAHHFSVAVSPSKHGHEGVAIEYPPFARFVLEASTMNRFTGEGADDWGKPGATSGSGSWWEIVPQTAAKCQKAQKKAKSKSKFIKSLKSKIKKKANGSDIEGKHFSKALSSAGIKLPKSALEDLMGLLGGEDAVDWKAFLKVFKVKLEDVDDDNDEDDSDDDGSSGSDDGSDDDTSKDSDSGDSEDSESPSSLLKLFGKAMMMASDPRSWIDSVCYLFSECDMDGNGYLDPKEFLTLTKKVGVKLTKSEFKKLSAEMDDDGNGNISYIEILSSLLKAFKSGANGGKAFLGDEREIAEKILDAMGENPGARRRWLSKLRKNFFSLDKFNNGTMQGPKLIRVLRDSGVRLSRSEEGRLLELLPTMEDEEGGGEDDASGSVSYRELLRFCASSAGKWYEQDVDLAEGLRSALRDKMRKKSFVPNLKACFDEFDESGSGVVSKKEFEKACKKMGMRIESPDSKKLMEILDIDGSGNISYQDFVSFFNNSSGKRDWYDCEPEIARKIKGSIVKATDSKAEEAVFGFRDASIGCDEDGNGFCDARDFRKNILRNIKVKLSEKDVSKLSMVLDDNGDGLMNYRPVVRYLIKCLPPLSDRFPDEFSTVQRQIQKSKSGKRGVINSLEERCKVADKDGNGAVSVKALLSAMSRCGVKASSSDVKTLAEGLDPLGQGTVDYHEFLDQLKGSHSYGREEWYEQEASMAQRLRKAIWKEHGGSGRGKKGGGRWQKDLRASFEKFDRDGDGVVSPKDFSRAIQSLDIKVSRGDLDRLMELLDKNGDGLLSYEDFVDFMVSKDDPGDRSDYDGYDSHEEGTRERRKRGGRSDYSTVVGEYDERLGGRGGGKNRSRSPAKGGRSEPNRGQEKSKELVRIRKKIMSSMDGRGSAAEKKMTSKFQDIDKEDRGLVSVREFHSAMKKCGLSALKREDLSLLSSEFDSEDDGRFNWEEFVNFVFHPERRKGRGRDRDRGRGDEIESEDSDDNHHERRRKPSPSYNSRRGGRGTSSHGGRPQSRKQRSRYPDDDDYSEDLDSYGDDSRTERLNVRGVRAKVGRKTKRY